MKRLFAAALLLFACFLGACGSASDVESETTTEALQVKHYTHEERMEILDDTKLGMSSDFYIPEERERYFELLQILQDEYYSPGAVSDAYFAEFVELKQRMETSFTNGYPTLMIEAEGINKNNYVKGSIKVIEDGVITESPITITIRGNSTADAPKKPYNIKFEESVSLFGLEEGKKWSLLANAYDKTLIRNTLALGLARDLELPYTSQTTHVEVWVNGKYQGNYLLSEPVSDGKNRVGIDTAGNDAILEITPFGGYTFVTDGYVAVKIDNPDPASSEQKKYLQKFLELAEEAMKTGDQREYTKYVDVESFIDFYILTELFKDVDGYWKSLYCFVEDGKLYAGPAWDYDLTCGNVNKTRDEYNFHMYHNKPGYGDGSWDSTHGLRMDLGWFSMLLDDEDYVKAVRERYKELQPVILALFEGEDCEIDKIIAANKESFEREYRGSELGNHGAGWSVTENYGKYNDESKGSYEDNVEYLKEWLRERNEWLLAHIGEQGQWKEQLKK